MATKKGRMVTIITTREVAVDQNHIREETRTIGTELQYLSMLSGMMIEQTPNLPGLTTGVIKEGRTYYMEGLGADGIWDAKHPYNPDDFYPQTYLSARLAKKLIAEFGEDEDIDLRTFHAWVEIEYRKEKITNLL